MERYDRGTTETVKGCHPVIRSFFINLLDIYGALIAPYIPTECRFSPTCSSYMKEAIEKKGVIKGILCGLKRILRCNPLFPGGYDPVK